MRNSPSPRKRVFRAAANFAGGALGTGNPALAVMNNFHIGALDLQVGDMSADLFGLGDVDTQHPIYVRCLWTSNSATLTDDVTFIVQYKNIVIDGTTTPEKPSAGIGTGLNTPIAEDRVLGTYQLQATSWGKLDGGALAGPETFLALEVEMDATDVDVAGDENVWLLGLELEYTPLDGPTSRPLEAKAPTYADDGQLTGQ
jgi:hypothetical protein